jgi:hypothetical protein
MLFSIPSVNEIIEKSLQVFKRFPFVLIASFIATGITIYFIQVEPKALEGIYLILAKSALSAMLGIFVFTALRLLGNTVSNRLHLFITLLALSGLLLYYFILPDETKAFEGMIVFFRHSFLILLFFIAVMWTPFVRSDLNNGDYLEYAKQILFSLVMTIIFTVVMVLGVNGALFAVEKLFELSIKGKLYGQIDIFIIGVFSVGYFLSQIPENPLCSKRSEHQPRVEKFFTKWILTPLSGLYFIILYAYTFKVLITMDWPKGILAWLIVIFSIVAILTYLFWTHFATHQTGKWRRWIWLAVLLQTFMLFAAIGMRIAEYSWTESRYMVFILGLWLAGISVYFLLFKEAKIKWIFLSLSLVIAISQVGPLSAYAVSKIAQTDRLIHMLPLLKKANDPQKATLKLRYEISDVVGYLYGRYGVEGVAQVFPKICKTFKVLEAKEKAYQKVLKAKMKNEKVHIASREEINEQKAIFKDKPQYFPHYVAHELGFKFLNRWEYEREKDPKNKNAHFYVMNPPYPRQSVIDLRGYDYMSNFYGNSYVYVKRKHMARVVTLDNMGVDLLYEDHVLTLRKEKQFITFDMEPYTEALVKKYGNRSIELTQKELTLFKENDMMKVKIEMHNLDKTVQDGNTTINFSANIFFKLKE